MSEIPADVSRAAEPWGEAALIAWTSGAGRAAVMSMVAGAILEERERCAMVARDQPLPELEGQTHAQHFSELLATAQELESAANCGLDPNPSNDKRYERRLRNAISEAVEALRRSAHLPNQGEKE